MIHKLQVIMVHIHCMNTQVIFRVFQCTNFKFVTEDAYANQSQNRNRVGREDIALWTKIVEKVVNVEEMIHGLLLLGKLSKLFVFEKFLCS